MPNEGIRGSTTTRAPGHGIKSSITVRERTVRIHLVGVLDRQEASRLIQVANRHLYGRRYDVILDASHLVHLDYRCVAMLLRWNRGLQSLGHRLLLAGWSPYLRTILAMEDWDGELEKGVLGSEPRPAHSLVAHVQAP
jgi:ABC-type transporter Mla MlaB component